MQGPGFESRPPQKERDVWEKCVNKS